MKIKTSIYITLYYRKYGERLFKIVCKEAYFDIFLKKYLDKEELVAFKKHLKQFHKKHSVDT